MSSYILKKILQTVMVLVCVVSLVYVLQNTSVIDPVEDFLLSSFGDRSFSSEDFEKSYRSEAIRQNRHLPAFYFSVEPSYIPKNISEFVFYKEKSLIRKLSRYSRCPSCVIRFIEAKRALEIGFSKLHANEVEDLTVRKVNVLIGQIDQSDNLHKLDRMIKKIGVLNIDYSFIPEVDDLVARWNALYSDRKLNMPMPRISWNGLQNQYHQYISGLFNGKFGISKTDGQRANRKILNALKWTLSINIIAFLLAGGIGLIIGLWSMKYDGTKLEKSITSFLYFVYTMPVFWVATLLLIFFTTKEYGAWTNIFPSTGIKYWYSDEAVIKQVALNAQQLILPIICITLPSLAYLSRIMKSKFAEVLTAGFIIPLKAKGLNENQILFHHVLRNGMIPYITIMTGSIPGLFAGSLVIEIIFNIPGIGKLLYQSIFSSDWSVISGLIIMLSIVTVMAYFLADLLYSWANPKINVLES